MAITAGAATDKIVELRSKLAIYDAMSELLRSSYMPSDGGAPEVRIDRDDGGVCTAKHFESVLEDLEVKMTELNEELVGWEGLLFEPKKAEVTPIRQPQGEDEPAKKERPKVHARRLQPAAKNP